MNVVNGKLRTVIAFSDLRIAVKLPTPPTMGAVLACLKQIHKFRFWKIIFQQKSGNIVYLFITAILANWREYKFFKTTHYPILQPTLFSFFGIFNIQELGTPLKNIVGHDIWATLWSFATDKASGQLLYQDMHHLTNGENFSRGEDGRLRILDYSEPQTQDVLKKFGEDLYERFNNK